MNDIAREIWRLSLQGETVLAVGNKFMCTHSGSKFIFMMDTCNWSIGKKKNAVHIFRCLCSSMNENTKVRLCTLQNKEKYLTIGTVFDCKCNSETYLNILKDAVLLKSNYYI